MRKCTSKERRLSMLIETNQLGLIWTKWDRKWDRKRDATRRGLSVTVEHTGDSGDSKYGHDDGKHGKGKLPFERWAFNPSEKSEVKNRTRAYATMWDDRNRSKSKSALDQTLRSDCVVADRTCRQDTRELLLG